MTWKNLKLDPDIPIMLICSQNKCHFSNDILAFIHHPITVLMIWLQTSLFLSVLPSSCQLNSQVSLGSLWLLQVLITMTSNFSESLQNSVSPAWPHLGHISSFELITVARGWNLPIRLASGSGGSELSENMWPEWQKQVPKPAEAVIAGKE